MAAKKLLVVDDDSNLLEFLHRKLKSAEYEAKTMLSASEAAATARDENFDLCVVDLRLADGNGISLMSELHSINPHMPVIILTGFGTVESAVEAMRKGAYSYLTKPVDARELMLQIERALENSRLNYEIQRLQGLLEEKYSFPNIVAKSDGMKRVLDVVNKIAKTESTVYLHGESGTGKEVIAKAIHFASPRRDHPFVAINCAAVPEPLLESELFGHEKGAFTGAVKSTRGLFSQADGGTIFLDEIGDMPSSIQAKLLRVLQERQFYPVGTEKPVDVNVRIIVATNKELEKEVEKGTFRQDLFFRLHVIPIHLPPLRERKEDVPYLAERFLKQLAQQMKKNVKGLTPEALRKLMLYDWPGNVRELENMLEYAVAMSRDDLITEDLVLQRRDGAGRSRNEQTASDLEISVKGPLTTYKNAKYEFERTYLIQLLQSCGGKASEAAKIAGKCRTDFYDLLRKHDIKIDRFRSGNGGGHDHRPGV
jgi:two-component system response regulator GlrR